MCGRPGHTGIHAEIRLHVDLGMDLGVQQLHQLAGRRPVRRILRQAALDERRQLLWHPRQIRLVMHHLIRHQIGALRVERPAPGGRMHQHRPQREHIRGGAHLARPLELLGRHERRRTDQLAGLGAHFTVGRPRYPEIDDFRSVGGQQYISRLQIAVDDPGAMDVAQRLGESRGQLPYLIGRQWPLPLHMLGKRRPGNVEGRHPGPFGIRIGVHDGRRKGPADPPRGRHLLPEPPPELGVLGEFGMNDLDREPQPGRRARQMHHAHSPGTQPCLQAILPGVFRTLRFRVGPGITQRRHRSTPVSCPVQCGRGCDARSLVDDTCERDEAC